MDPATPPPVRRRLRLALSLRAMMVLVLVVGIAMAWVVTRARAQRDAVAAIEAMDGFVMYDDLYSGGAKIPGGKPRGLAWMRRWLGIDYFQHVTRVIFRSGETKKSLEILGRFPELESLWISHEKFSEENLVRISGLPRLRELKASFSDITDDGIEHLARLPDLRKLEIAYTPITDRAIGILSRCRRLEALDLQGTKVTPEGIERLADIPSLRRVNLGTVETKKALTSLGKVGQLESVEMDYLPDMQSTMAEGRAALSECLRNLRHLRALKIDGIINDEALVEIGKLDGLEDLDLDGTFTDQGLPHLRGLARLKTLKLGRLRNLTPEGIAALQAALPGLKITR